MKPSDKKGSEPSNKKGAASKGFQSAIDVWVTKVNYIANGLYKLTTRQNPSNEFDETGMRQDHHMGCQN